LEAVYSMCDLVIVEYLVFQNQTKTIVKCQSFYSL
jgi:hypothetical protein